MLLLSLPGRRPADPGALCPEDPGRWAGGCTAGQPRVGLVPAQSFTLVDVFRETVFRAGPHLPPLLFAETQNQASASPGHRRTPPSSWCSPWSPRGHRGGSCWRPVSSTAFDTAHYRLKEKLSGPVGRPGPRTPQRPIR